MKATEVPNGKLRHPGDVNARTRKPRQVFSVDEQELARATEEIVIIQKLFGETRRIMEAGRMANTEAEQAAVRQAISEAKAKRARILREFTKRWRQKSN